MIFSNIISNHSHKFRLVIILCVYIFFLIEWLLIHLNWFLSTDIMNEKLVCDWLCNTFAHVPDSDSDSDMPDSDSDSESRTRTWTRTDWTRTHHCVVPTHDPHLSLFSITMARALRGTCEKHRKDGITFPERAFVPNFNVKHVLTWSFKHACKALSGIMRLHCFFSKACS